MPDEITYPDSVKKLMKQADEVNLAKGLEDKVLNEIAQRVCSEYDVDVTSRADWERFNEEALKLARLLPEHESKSTPWPGASNVVYPLVAQSAIQFAARSATVGIDGKTVKCKVIGDDPEGEKAARAERVGDHMSWQLDDEMESWHDDDDRLRAYYAVSGIGFKKTYRNEETGVNVSEFVSAENLVVHYWAKSLEEASRVTHTYHLMPREIEEKKRAGVYLDIELGEGDKDAKEGGLDEGNPYLIVEQHRWLDFDDEGYEKPYIITVAKSLEKVLRIVARWDNDSDSFVWNEKTGQIVKIFPEQYFTDFAFLPSLDGSYYPLGLGTLLREPNNIVNSLINQLIDAGTLANSGGGFISDKLRLGGPKKPKSGVQTFVPGEFKVFESDPGQSLDELVYPFKFADPSATLFNLLGLAIESSEKLGSATDVLTGQEGRANQPATTTLALIEQGLQVFTAVKARQNRSYKKEFKKLYDLNRKHLNDEEYFTVVDDVQAIAKEDYNDTDLDVAPVADPKSATDTQKLVRAEALMALRQNPPQNKYDLEVNRRYLEALGVEDIDKILPEEDAVGGPPPELQIELKKLELEEQKIAIEQVKVEAEIAKTEAEMELAKDKAKFDNMKTHAEAVKALTEAEAKEIEPVVDTLKEQIKADAAAKKAKESKPTAAKAKPKKAKVKKKKPEGKSEKSKEKKG